MNKLPRRLIFVSTYLFIALFFALISFLTFVTVKQRDMAVAANISHFVVPIIFYAADSAPPSQAKVDALTNSYNAVRYWYAAKTGQTFEYLPVKVYRGERTRDYYLNSDDWRCGSTKIMCNILNEIGMHERSTLRAFGVPDTSFGWWDRATMIFTSDMPYVNNPPTAWAHAQRVTGRGGYSVLSSVVLDTLANEHSACNTYSDLVGATNYQRWFTCLQNTQIGTIAHEMGHAIAALPDASYGGDQCRVDIMCQGTFSFTEATFFGADMDAILNSPFTNPPIIGSADYNSLMPPLNLRFCFESDDPHQWCMNTSPFSGVPVPEGETSLDPKPYAGGDCNAFGCNGPSFNADWPDVTYKLDYRCVSGPYCNNEWNTWTECSSWPQGCPPVNTTKTYADVLMGDSDLGYAYEYRVWIVTKRDGDPNNVASYPWVNPKLISQNCSGASCTQRITWNPVTYDAQLAINGQVENGLPVNACKNNWTDPINGTVSSCESAWSGTESNHLFTQLNTGVKLDLYVNVKDMDNVSHVLVTSSNIGTTGGCTGGFCECSATTPAIPTNLSAALSGSAGSQSVDLRWGTISNWGQECGKKGAREYRIKFSESSTFTNDFMRTGNINLPINNLKPSTTYYFKVAAENKAGQVSSYSNVFNFTTVSSSSLVPPTPTSITNLPSCLNSGQQFGLNLVFNWTTVSGATGYNVRITRDVNTGGDYSLKSSTTNNTKGLGGWDSFGNPRVVWVKGGSLYFDTNVKYFIAVEATNGSIRSGYDLTGKSLSFGPIPVCPDKDKDGFSDKVEDYMGTDKAKACGINAWPADVNDDKVVNSGDQAILATHVPSSSGQTKYSRRFDLNGDTVINSGDQAIMAKFVGKSCI